LARRKLLQEMFRRKKKEEPVRKMSLTVEQLVSLIKEHPEGLKFEELQEVLSEKNIEAMPSTLYKMLVKLERDKAIMSEIRLRKQAGWDRRWFPKVPKSIMMKTRSCKGHQGRR